MKPRIFLVDDDLVLLSFYLTALQNEFEITVVSDSQNGIKNLKESTSNPYQVIIADYNMPGMDGIQFLRLAKEITPDSVRIMLTSSNDIHIAINALSEGDIFRFLNKPCSPDTLAKNIRFGVDQYNLVTLEKTLLEKTLLGSIGILMEILSIFNPEVFSQTIRLRSLAKKVISRLKLENSWEIEMSILLSQIGCITIPPNIISKYYQGKPLTEEESELYYRHPISGHKFISRMPRLEKIAEGIKFQFVDYESAEMKPNMLSQFIKVLTDYDRLIHKGKLPKSVFEIMNSRKNVYDSRLLQALEAEFFHVVDGFVVKSIKLEDLRVGMVLADDLISERNVTILRKGFEITDVMLERIQNFQHFEPIQEPIKVLDAVI
jgi:CheY-like chemotaxis protein